MSYSDNDERPEEETQEANASEANPQADSNAGDEHEEQDPAVAEIEEDPSRNPPNEVLRDIKGG